MTKNRFLLGALAIALVFGMVFSGCKTESDDDDSGGTLTITGLKDYNDKYAKIDLDSSTPDLSFGKRLDSGLYDMPKISGGRVTFPVWKKDEAAVVTRYDGDDSVSLTLFICTQANFRLESREKEGTYNVSFSGGSQTVDASLFNLHPYQ